MKLRILTAVVVLVSLFPGQASAVENGTDASGNPFVVPIKVQIDTNSLGGCSGALIAPSIVVTAGHCLLDKNGLVSKLIYVGQAGSSMQSIIKSDVIQSIKITSSFQTSANNTIGEDDLAFLTLSKPQIMTIPVVLASESQIASFKSSKVNLKVIGYGRYGATSEEVVTQPKSFSGNFSSIPVSGLANSAFMESTLGNSCQGDSGSPIINTTATQVTVVGILTGGSKNGFCTQLQNGTYYSVFTLIGRYANLAFAAASDQIDLIQKQKNDADESVVDLSDQLQTASVDLVNANFDLETARNSIIELQAQLAALQAKSPTSIICVKGKLIRRVSAVSPKCPAGYKKK